MSIDVDDNGILSHFQTRMKFINFEQKNREASLAIQGPRRDNVSASVSNSMALAQAHDRIHDMKTDNIINLLDSVLRRNKEFDSDEDDVL